MRDHTPDAVLDGHEFGNANTGDLPLLWPRHRAVAPAIHDEAMAMVRQHYFNRSPLDERTIRLVATPGGPVRHEVLGIERGT
jgi:hypothetical protein